MSRSENEDSNAILGSPLLFENSDLEVMLRLAIRTNLDALSRAVENALVDRVKNNVDNVPLIRSLALAEELGMRKFQGRLYYSELVRQESLQTGIQLFTTSHTNGLTEKQLLTLFRGYWSLMHYWKNLLSIVQNTPLPLIPPCVVHKRCQAIWVDTFTDTSPLNFGPLDELKKLRSSLTLSLKNDVYSRGEARPCGPRELYEITRQIQVNLADHFLGPGPEAL